MQDRFEWKRGDLCNLSVLDPQHVDHERPVLGVARPPEVAGDGAIVSLATTSASGWASLVASSSSSRSG
jgi:hypothetical protein